MTRAGWVNFAEFRLCWAVRCWDRVSGRPDCTCVLRVWSSLAVVVSRGGNCLPYCCRCNTRPEMTTAGALKRLGSQRPCKRHRARAYTTPALTFQQEQFDCEHMLSCISDPRGASAGMPLFRHFQKLDHPSPKATTKLRLTPLHRRPVCYGTHISIVSRSTSRNVPGSGPHEQCSAAG